MAMHFITHALVLQAACRQRLVCSLAGPVLGLMSHCDYSNCLHIHPQLPLQVRLEAAWQALPSVLRVAILHQDDGQLHVLGLRQLHVRQQIHLYPTT